MPATPWSPTQQVRALLLLHELAASLAVEARARTLHGCPQLAAQVAAVGKRALPQALHDMAGWSALRLAGAREALRTAVAQYEGSSAWAERVTADVILLLRQGERFTSAAHRLDDLARAIAATDDVQTERWFESILTLMHRFRHEHTGEDADGAVEAWTPAIERLLKAAIALGINIVPPPPDAPPRDKTPAGEPVLAASSTPYQPSSATEQGSTTGGSHALRRRR